MRVLVVHHRWGYGGAMVVFYYTVRALAEAGFDVTVSTADEPELRAYEDIVGEPLPERVRIKAVLPYRVRAFTIYKGLISWVEAFRGQYDAIVSTSAHGFPVAARRIKAPIVYYMHFPPLLMTDTRWNPAFSRYSLKNPLRHGVRESLLSVVLWLYARPYVFLARRFYRDLVEVSKKILVNSTYTLNALRHSLHLCGLDESFLEKAEIVYPPLPGVESLLSARRGEKEPCVVTLGRFSSEKNYELVAETARIIRDVVFHIAGEVHGGPSRSYYEKIRRISPPNVVLEANITQERKIELLSRCRAYLHPMAGEHFGIAPLEALAAGSTPVVHVHSGTWTDVCLEGEYCYGFESYDPREVAERVERALSWPKKAPLEHIEKFSPQNFSRKVVKAVEEATGP